MASWQLGVPPLATPRVMPGDVGDDHVIAAAAAVAVAGGAEIVVSGHLLSLGQHQGIRIFNAIEAGRRVDDARSNP